jgi:hypothetical protein
MVIFRSLRHGFGIFDYSGYGQEFMDRLQGYFMHLC